MFNDLLLTFVVPCYNVERYIQRCLDSIYACGLHEEQYEVICINDCSPDNVQGILEWNRKIHGNLKIVVHKENKGWGGARNPGIRMARGKYIWFVDSDDDIMGSCLQEVLDRTCTEDLDMLCFNYRRVDLEGNEIPIQYYIKDVPAQNGVSFAKTAFEGGLALNMGYVVRFLFKTEFLRSHDLFFPENVCWEDTVFVPKSILLANKIAASAVFMYSYRMNPKSVSNTFSSAYPAKLIYDYAFCTGRDLLRFSEEVEDVELSDELRKAAINRYINGFPLFLFRTNKMERRRFWGIVNSRKEEVKTLKEYMKVISRLMLLPIVGPVFTEMGAIVYTFKHRKD